MSTSVLPSLAGMGIDIKRTPMFKTRRQVSVSGKEVRIADWAYPRYSWEIVFNALRQGTFQQNALTEYATLEGFFEGLQGGWDSFLFTDPDDNSVTTQGIGVGDGSTKNFPLVRAFGGTVAPILAPNGAVAVFDNGSPAGSYSVTPWGTSDPNGPGVVEFVSAPANGHVITATFAYYFPVRFDDDKMTFERFVYNIYKVQKTSFTSIK